MALPSGLILENTGMRAYNKKGQESPVKGRSFGFLHFCKFRAFRTLHPPKRHVFLEVLVEKKACRFSKRALRADTTHGHGYPAHIF